MSREHDFDKETQISRSLSERYDWRILGVMIIFFEQFAISFGVENVGFKSFRPVYTVVYYVTNLIFPWNKWISLPQLPFGGPGRVRLLFDQITWVWRSKAGRCEPLTLLRFFA